MKRIVTLAIVVVSAFSACKKPLPPAVRPPRPVLAVAASARDVPLYVDEIGRCVAYEFVTIRPQVSGLVTEVLFTDGAEVKKGDRLFTIDPRPFQATYNAALARYNQEKAKATFDKSQLNRNQKLSERQVVSSQDLDSSKSAEQASQAAVEASRADAETARINVDYCAIVSPLDGRAGKHLVDVGNIVNANQTSLLEIQRQQPLYVEFTIPENLLTQVRSFLSKGTLSVQVSVPDVPSSSHLGKLDFMDSGVNAATGTVLMRAVLENADRCFIPGQFVQVRILLDTLHNAVLIPGEAVQTGADQPFVYVILPNNTVEVRKIKVGQLQDREIVVTEGLAAGEKVVGTGQIGLSKGAAVQIVNK